VFCVKCGEKLIEGSQFCSKCGSSTNAGTPGAQSNSGQSGGTHQSPIQPQAKSESKGIMPKVKTAAFVLVVIIVAVFAFELFSGGGSSSGSASLVGTWSNDANPSHRYTFQENGNGTRGMGGALNESFTWRIEGNTVIIATWLMEERWDFRIRGNSVTFTNGPLPGTFRYSRVS